MPDDAHLRESFARLREREAADAPSFRSVRARKPHNPPRRVFLVAAALVLVIGLLLLVVPRHPSRVAVKPADAPVPVSAAIRPAPTDFLLQTPQRNLLRTVPKFGETQPYATKGAS